MAATSIIILVSVVVAIALGYSLKINIGWFALAFAFVLGVFMCDIAPNAIIAMWPTKLFFQLLTVMFFYNFAINNGTLELVAKKIVYLTRKTPALIPVALWVMFAILSGIGPGAVAMFLALAPLLMTIADEIGMNPIMVPVIMTSAGSAGGWSPIAVQGLLTQSLIEAGGYPAEEATRLMLVVWQNTLLCAVVVFIVGYFVFKAYKSKAAVMEKPEPFKKNQKINLVLIAIVLALLIIPSVVKGITGNAFFAMLAKSIDVTYVCIVFAIIAILLKIGDEKKAMMNVPWNTIIMLCGAGTLLAVASSAGVLDYLSVAMSQNVALGILPYAMGIIAGVMSVFSSTTGVVMPTLYPLVMTITTATGFPAAILFSVIPITASYSGMSPFSTAGGLALAAVKDESKKNAIVIKLIITAFSTIALVMLLIAVGAIRS